MIEGLGLLGIRKEAAMLKRIKELLPDPGKAEDVYSEILKKLKLDRAAGTRKRLLKMRDVPFSRPPVRSQLKDRAMGILRRGDLAPSEIADEYVGRLLDKPGYNMFESWW